MSAPETLHKKVGHHIPAYLDAARLCEELCICERTAEAWVKQGVLPAPKMRGGKRLWKWMEVERYLDDGGPGVSSSADPIAERIRDATKRLAEAATENRRGHIRRGHQSLSGKPDLQEPGAGDAKELSRVTGDG